MNKTKVLFMITFICLLGSANNFAQTQNQPRQADTSYEIVLHILNASNSTANKASVPQSLSNVVKKLKNIYPYSNYNLDSTYLGRVANLGTMEFRGVSKKTEQNQENSANVFTDWTINVLRSLPDSQTKNSIQ